MVAVVLALIGWPAVRPVPALHPAPVVRLAPAVATAPSPHAAPRWRLTWRDEFNGPARSAPDPNKWGYDTGGGGWGNNELEYYTTSRDNSYLDGHGHLIIKALRQPHEGRDYTSARLKTEGKFAQAYGRFEARIKLPSGDGVWPAFWALGDDVETAGWPTCGEIDIMENAGPTPGVNHGSLHGPGYDFTNTYTLPAGKRFGDSFHVFAVEWEPAEIRFYVDKQMYLTVPVSKTPDGKKWVFDHPYFIILNLAIGGNFTGSPAEHTEFPQEMVVDYVRVYEAANTR